MSSYTKILLKEFFTAIKLEIIDCYRAVDISDKDLDNMLSYRPERETYENS